MEQRCLPKRVFWGSKNAKSSNLSGASPPDPHHSSAMDLLGLKSPPRPPDLIATPIDGSKLAGMQWANFLHTLKILWCHIFFFIAGSSTGTVISLFLSGILCKSIGWPLAFYAFGKNNILFFLWGGGGTGDLPLAFAEKLTNQKHSNAQLCPDMSHNHFVM